MLLQSENMIIENRLILEKTFKSHAICKGFILLPLQDSLDKLFATFAPVMVELY